MSSLLSMGFAMLLDPAAAMQIGPVSNKELSATTIFLNLFLISAIMSLVFIAILHKELTRRSSAARTVNLEEEVGKIDEVGPNRISIRAQMVARNRSSVPTRLKRIDFSVYADGILLGRSSQASGTIIPPGPTFIFEKTLDLPLKEGKHGTPLAQTVRAPLKVVGSLHLETVSGDARLPFGFEAQEKVVHS